MQVYSSARVMVEFSLLVLSCQTYCPRLTYGQVEKKTKSKKQIKNIANAYIVRDNIEIGSNNIIPLWLFGFLY